MAQNASSKKNYTAVEMEEKKRSQSPSKTNKLEKPFDDEFWLKVSQFFAGEVWRYGFTHESLVYG